MTNKNSNKNLPIGVFDSGVGGLTVVKEIDNRLPDERIIYFGDTARYPYGPRSEEIVEEFALQAADLLVKRRIKLLIVACNTASSIALESLREKLNIPVIGVIEPGAEAAIDSTDNGKIGVIGTRATIESQSYKDFLKKMDPETEIFGKPCPLFVSLAQEGWTRGKIPGLVAERYLNSLRDEDIDTLILGCTHYPLLKEPISKFMEDRVALIDSAIATVTNLSNVLEEMSLLTENTEKENLFLVSDAPQRFRKVGSRFLKRELQNVSLIRI